MLIKLPPKSQREEKQSEEEKGSLSQDKSENEGCALILDLVFFCSIKLIDLFIGLLEVKVRKSKYKKNMRKILKIHIFIPSLLFALVTFHFQINNWMLR